MRFNPTRISDLSRQRTAAEAVERSSKLGMQSMSDNFQTAYKRARQKIGAAAWTLLSNDLQAEAVSRELRALESERLRNPGDDAKEVK
jgi:hypothetical protein